MTIEETRVKIEQEFMNRFYEFINDVNEKEINDRDFGWKYGYVLTESMKKKFSKGTQSNLMWFQSHIFSGKYLQQWKADGINPIELHRIGFLSYDYCSSHKARMLGKTDFYYISQATAKEIYKAHKGVR